MKYRLQYFDSLGSVLAISFGHDCEERMDGDCVVRAVKEETDIDAYNKANFQQQKYTEPMTIESLRSFILGLGNEAVGDDIKRCLGLNLEDCNNEKVLFNVPIAY